MLIQVRDKKLCRPPCLFGIANGYLGNPNSSELSIVTVVLQYGVFAREYDAYEYHGYFVTYP